MSSIRDMAAQGVAQTASQAPDFTGAMAKGAELAQTIETMRTKREELQARKTDQTNQKWTVVGNMYDRWKQMPDGEAKKNIGQKVIPAMLQSFGFSQEMNPAVAEIIAKDPMIGAFLTNRVRSGGIDLGNMIAATKDTEAFVNFLVENDLDKFESTELIKSTIENSLPELTKAAEDRQQSNESTERSQMAIEAASGRQTSGQNFTASRDDKTNAEAYSNNLAKYNIPQMEVRLSAVDKIIPGGLAGYDGKTQIEGIGGKDSLIPIGRLSKKGRENRQAAAALKNEFIKYATGAGMSAEEAIRLGSGIGLDVAVGEGGGLKAVFVGTKSSSDFVTGVKELNKSIEASKTNLKAGAGLNAVRYYEQNKAALSAPKKKFNELPAAKQKEIIEYHKKKNPSLSEVEIRKKLEAK